MEGLLLLWWVNYYMLVVIFIRIVSIVYVGRLSSLLRVCDGGLVVVVSSGVIGV